HPQLEDSIEEDVRYTQFDMAHEGHNRMVMRGGAPSRSVPAERLALREPLLSMLRSWDLDPQEFAGREYETRTSLQSRMRELGPERGHGHYEHLRDEQLTDAYHFNVFPNCSITFAADAMLLQRVRPHPSDPQRCVFDHWRYASPASIATARIKQADGTITSEVSAEREVFDYGTQSLGIIGDQDLGVTTGQQLSFGSRGYRRAELAGQEARISRFHEVIDQYIASRPGPERR
ncbi:MAG: SRPBCC family protein, partial [Actinomycetota bacterium]